jgi:hypothetical protein
LQKRETFATVTFLEPIIYKKSKYLWIGLKNKHSANFAQKK